jgi:hypothetical protein
VVLWTIDQKMTFDLVTPGLDEDKEEATTLCLLSLCTLRLPLAAVPQPDHPIQINAF